MSWTKNYPKQVSKNDLCGKVLRTLADKPPENTEKDYLKRLALMDTENSQVYNVLVTLRDIQKIIDLMPKPFTFDKKPDAAWAEVKEVRQNNEQ